MDYWGEKILLPHGVREGQAVNGEVWMTRVREPRLLSLCLSGCPAGLGLGLAWPCLGGRSAGTGLCPELCWHAVDRSLVSLRCTPCLWTADMGKELCEVGSRQTQMPVFPGVLQTNDNVLADSSLQLPQIFLRRELLGVTKT